MIKLINTLRDEMNGHVTRQTEKGWPGGVA